jgi:uncharacterized OB-fold protein
MSDAAHFWSAAGEGRLELQRCDACGRLRFFPGAVCPHCLAEGGQWQPLSGDARVYAFSVVHRAPGPIFAAHAPYVIALVDLDEGARVMARLDCIAADPPPVATTLVFAGVGDDGAGPYLRFRAAAP